MKNKLEPFVQLAIGTLLVIGVIIAVMYLILLPFKLAFGSSFKFTDLYLSDLPPETVSPRSLLKTHNLELLWVKEMDINNPHQVNVEFFVPFNKSVVFWSPQSESIIALDLLTGNMLWETAVPYVWVVNLYNGNFYITSHEWLDQLEKAPKDTDGSFISCSFTGQVSLLAINAATGSQTWAYAYQGARGGGAIRQNSIYLTDSTDHGASRAIIRVDTTTGTILESDCYQWPDEKEFMIPSGSESQGSATYLPVLDGYDEKELSGRYSGLIAVTNGYQLDILDRVTNEIVGSISFEGATLYHGNIDIIIQGNIIVVYLRDSHQLFGIQFPRYTS